MDDGDDEGQEIICAFNNSYDTISNTMQIRAESSIAAGTVLENVFDSNDTVTVSATRTVTVSVPGNSYKIYKIAEDQPEVEYADVTFTIQNASTYWGQSAYLVGNCDALGNWNTSLAVGPASCPDYPTWTVSVSLPIGETIEFKAIKKDGNGNVTWENGNNHSYTVPSEGGNCIIQWN